MAIQKLTFNRKPTPLNPEFRPLYKMCVILLILKISSRSNTSSLLKLHFFSWMIKNEERRKQLISIVEDGNPQLPIFNIEPSLNQAILFLSSEGLIDTLVDRFKLTEKGSALIGEILDDATAFEKEIGFLNLIGKKFNEKKVDELLNHLSK